MAYNEKTAARIRERLAGRGNVEEKEMFGGIAFMEVRLEYSIGFFGFEFIQTKKLFN